MPGVRYPIGRSFWLLVAAALASACSKASMPSPPDAYEDRRVCFAAGTRIATTRGMEPIETLTPGRMVLSYDVVSGRVIEGRVSAVLVHPRKPVGRLAFADGRVLRMTEEHPVYLADRRAFVPAKAVPVGAAALTLHPVSGVMPLPIDGAYAAVADLQPVYNLTVDGQHNYFAEGVLVHNKQPCRQTGCCYPPCPDPPLPPTDSCPSPPSEAQVEESVLARRLMLLVWGEVDPKILDQVGSGALTLRLPPNRREFVERLLADPRARAGTRSFVQRWLSLDDRPPPHVPEALWPRLLEETLLFATEALLAKGNALQELLGANYTFVDAVLARHYGLSVDVAGFTKVPLDPAVRAGLLTHGAVLAARHNPAARGEFVLSTLLYGNPAGTFTANLPDDHPDFSPRTPARGAYERALAAAPLCADGCHKAFDGPGWALHRFDELGRARATETDGDPIDDRGWLEKPSEPVKGPRALAMALLSKQETRDAFAQQFLLHTTAVTEVRFEGLSRLCSHRRWNSSGLYQELLNDTAELLATTAPRDAGTLEAQAPQWPDGGAFMDAPSEGR